MSASVVTSSGGPSLAQASDVPELKPEERAGLGQLSRDAQRAWLGLILVAAFATYLAGALPHLRTLHNGDEANVVETALRMGSGVLEPFGLRHGTALPILLLAEFAVWYLMHLVSGAMAHPLDVAWAYLRDPTVFFLLGRLTAVAAGLGVIGLTYAIGRRLVGPVPGLLAAAFTGLSTLPLALVVRFKEELPAIVFLLIALVWTAKLGGLIRTARSPAWLALWAGVALGVASAFKYTAVLGGVWILLAAYWSVQREAPAFPWRVWLQRVLMAAMAAGAAFLLFTPSVVTSFGLLVQGIQDLTGGFTELPQAIPPTLTHLFRHLPHAVGVPLAVLMGGAGVVVLRRNFRAGLLLAAYPLVLIVFLSPYVGVASHLAMAMPCLGLLAGAGLTSLVETCVPQGIRGRRWLLVVLGGLLLWPACADSYRLIAVLRRPDTRTLARAWVEEHIPGGATLVVEGSRHTVLWLGPDLPGTSRVWQQDLADIRAGGGRGRLAQMRWEWAQAQPPAMAYNLTKVFVATPELLDEVQPDYVVTSGYFDADLFAGEPRGVVEALPCKKPGFLAQRLRLRRRLAEQFVLMAQFDPGVRFHEEFPMMYLGDFERLRRVPLWGDRSRLYQGPVISVYQRRSSTGRPEPQTTPG